MKLKLRVLSLFLVLLAVAGFFGYQDSFSNRHIEPKQAQKYQHGEVRFKNAVIPVELAQTNQQRSHGLSFRDSLRPGEGMLFVFPYPDRHTFWMKDMRFPLDIIWIAHNSIVDIKTNLPPGAGDMPPTYAPTDISEYVLEINAGEAGRYQIKVGDKVEIGF
jgi:uncharacterized membrane protein (UPF0127 family)